MFSFKENHNKPLTNANHLIMGRVINQDIGGHIRTEMVKKANTRRTNPDGSKKNNKLNKSIANGFFLPSSDGFSFPSLLFYYG